jgi:uncharacterized protein
MVTVVEEPEVVTLETPHGPARAHVHARDAAVAGLVLGHGAGGGVGAPDLLAATAAALEAGVAVALVEQPYRVAGRRSPAPARQLDAAWIAVVQQLRAAGPLMALDLVTGGRSSGARVACRTAAATHAIGVLCLAFPLQPPGRAGAAAPPPSRLDELAAVEVPVLVVQGVNDRFGMPEPAPGREVAHVKGDHRLASDRAAVREAVGGWLARLTAAPRAMPPSAT